MASSISHSTRTVREAWMRGIVDDLLGSQFLGVAVEGDQPAAERLDALERGRARATDGRRARGIERLVDGGFLAAGS